MVTGDASTVLQHGTAVAFQNTGVMLIGKSGSGKSSLALEMIARGATLVADDQVEIAKTESGLTMRAPKVLENQIEARGIGLLKVSAQPARLRYVVDLDVSETARLPELRETVILGERIPLLRRVESPAFSSMLLVLLQGGIA